MTPMTPEEQEAYFRWRVTVEAQRGRALGLDEPERQKLALGTDAAYGVLLGVVVRAIDAGDVTPVPADLHPSHSYSGQGADRQAQFFSARGAAPVATPNASSSDLHAPDAARADTKVEHEARKGSEKSK